MSGPTDSLALQAREELLFDKSHDYGLETPKLSFSLQRLVGSRHFLQAFSCQILSHANRAVGYMKTPSNKRTLPTEALTYSIANSGMPGTGKPLRWAAMRNGVLGAP